MILLIPLLFILFFIGIPIAYSLGLVSIAGILLTDPGMLINVPRRIFSGINNFSLVAVPLFILAGDIMSKGGISSRLIRFAQTLVGHFPAGLAMVVVVACMFFSAVSGSAIATAAAIGGMMIPAMKKEGYDLGFSSSLVATAGTIGPIIPPSIVLVLYGVMTSTSIGDLFLAGVIPGLMMGIVLMIHSYFVGKKYHYKGRENRASMKEIVVGLKDALLALIMPAIIIGGILSGIFTATESGIIAVVYALILGFFVYKELKIKDLFSILLESGKTTAIICFLIGNAALFSWLLSFHRIPDQLAELLGPFAENKILLLLFINVILLIVGTFIDTISALTIFTPLFVPLVMAADIDLIHFGIILAVNLTIGQATPPVGVCLFVTSQIAKIKIPEMFRFLLPQILYLIVVLLLLTYIPQLTLILPELIGGLSK